GLARAGDQVAIDALVEPIETSQHPIRIDAVHDHRNPPVSFESRVLRVKSAKISGAGAAAKTDVRGATDLVAGQVKFKDVNSGRQPIRHRIAEDAVVDAVAVRIEDNRRLEIAVTSTG